MAYNLIGQKYGHLTVVGLTNNASHRERHWLCKCDCGNCHIASSSNLVRGITKQCAECSKIQIGKSNTKHGTSPILLYRAYQNMKTRCNNEHYSLYHRYGGRGITICKEWQESFIAFREWALKNGYRKGLTLDRIDNDGNYCPENCRWVTMVEQSNNRVTNRMLSTNGETDTMANWSRRLDIPYWVLQRRLHDGWSEDRALGTPYKRQRCFHGNT